MRVTFRSLNRNMQHVINSRYEDLSRLQEQLATGKRLLRPSDDPVDVANDLKLRAKGAQLAQYKRNIEDGLGFMTVTDSAMNSMNDLLHRLRELAVQGATDTVGESERAFIGREVEQLLRQVVSLLNTRHKGEYVFSGTHTTIAPFPMENSRGASLEDYTQLTMAYYDASAVAPGNPVQLRDAFDSTPIRDLVPGSFSLSVAGTEYVEGEDYTINYSSGEITFLPTSPNAALLSRDISPGTPNYAPGAFVVAFDYVGQGRDIYGDAVTATGDILRELESGVTTPINIPGHELVNDTAAGTNLLDVIVTLGNDLLYNNRTGVQNAIGEIDSTFQRVLGAQSKNGARMNRLEITLDRNDQQYTESTRLLSQIEDADWADAVSDFKLAETVYNAALNSAAKVIQPSLANFL